MISAICKAAFLLLFLIGFALPMEGQFRFQADFKKKNPTVVATLDRFSKLNALSGASWGALVQEAASGKILASFNPRINLIPASNMKLMTSMNGLATLGPNFTFKTEFMATGSVSQGVLEGNLLVKGGGDPTIYSPDREKFETNFFTRLIAALKKQGIRKIEGKILLAESQNPYQGIRNDWSWSDIGNYYGAGIYAININENQYQVYIQATQEGKDGKLKKKDSLMDVELDQIRLETQAPGSPDLAYFYWVPGEDKVNLVGSLPAEGDNQKVKGALQNPSKIFLQVANQTLKEAGVEVLGESKSSENPKLLFTLDSPPLSRIVKEVNLTSNNLMTESIAYALVQPTSKLDENGWTQLEAFAKRIGCPQGYFFADGSGLSPTNRVSPEAFCKALSWVQNQPIHRVLLESLPVSGTSGTMKNYCKGATGKIMAKSGTLTRTFCYSGFATGKSKKLIFSIMINNYAGNFKEMKKELEKVLEGITETN